MKIITDPDSIYYPLEWNIEINVNNSTVRFLNQIYHPNVKFATGEISSFLVIKWLSSSMKRDFDSFHKYLVYLLDNPDPNCVENMEAANDIKNHPWDFIRKIKKCGIMPPRVMQLNTPITF